jgi:hypothetical protein
MALQDMMSELRGAVPKLPFAFTKTLVNRAWKTIRRGNLWSFQLYECSIITPPSEQAGTVTATQGSATITFDATALAALNADQIAQPYSLLTQRQFRIGSGGIYNIIFFNPITGVATLDRPFGDPSISGSSYLLYQVYYAPPFQDHRTWLSVRNPLLFLNLDLTYTRAMLDQEDPQRLIYQFPTRIVGWGRDQRGRGTANASSTLGFPLYELWGQPVAPFTYQAYGLRNYPDLTLPTDTLPDPLDDEDILLTLAKYYAYEWAEANRDISPRSTGPDWKFLMAQSLDKHKKLMSHYRREDKEFVDNWFSVRQLTMGVVYPFYNTISGVASTIGGLT